MQNQSYKLHEPNVATSVCEYECVCDHLASMFCLWRQAAPELLREHMYLWNQFKVSSFTWSTLDRTLYKLRCSCITMSFRCVCVCAHCRVWQCLHGHLRFPISRSAATIFYILVVFLRQGFGNHSFVQWLVMPPLATSKPITRLCSSGMRSAPFGSIFSGKKIQPHTCTSRQTERSQQTITTPSPSKCLGHLFVVQ